MAEEGSLVLTEVSILPDGSYGIGFTFKKKPMIVCLAGASGSGKTTLAKAIAKQLGWEFKENSAGLIIHRDAKEYMANEWGYEGNIGQVNVINRSHNQPLFGRYFQMAIMNARNQLMSSTLASGKNAVYDRGPLDPIVFYLNQVVHNFSEDEAERFFESCIPGLRKVDIIIRVPLQNPGKAIEDNGARVANWYFQEKIDCLYDLAIKKAELILTKDPFYTKPIHVFRTTTWDWDARLKECLDFIEKH